MKQKVVSLRTTHLSKIHTIFPGFLLKITKLQDVSRTVRDPVIFKVFHLEWEPCWDPLWVWMWNYTDSSSIPAQIRKTAVLYAGDLHSKIFWNSLHKHFEKIQPCPHFLLLRFFSTDWGLTWPLILSWSQPRPLSFPKQLERLLCWHAVKLRFSKQKITWNPLKLVAY